MVFERYSKGRVTGIDHYPKPGCRFGIRCVGSLLGHGSQQGQTRTNTDQGGPMKKPIYLTTAEVAETYRRSEYTVRLSMRDQSLHGEKATGSNRWLIDEECAAAWSIGQKCDHYDVNVRLIHAKTSGRASA